MNTDNFLSALIAEGKKKKRGRGRPKKPKVEDPKTQGKMSTKPKPKADVHRGSYKEVAVIASYTKRICTNCKHEELGSIPRIFILHQGLKDSSARVYKRLYHKGELTSWLYRLPLQVQLYPSYSPACKHCIQEMNDHAKSKKGQREDRGPTGPRPPSEAALVPIRTFQAIPGFDRIQAWWFEQVYNSTSQPGSTVSGGETA